MAATTRTITDKIYELDGTPLVGGMLTIERLTWPAIDMDGTVADTVVSGTTDEAGAVSLDVVVPPTGAARYRMTRPSGAGRQSHIYYFTLGAGSAITVREILAASATTDDADTIQDLIAGYLLAANNLSDVEDAETARTNLGLGSAAVAATGDFEAAGAVAAHTDAGSGAHAATAISVTPAGNLAATDVQAALEELQGDVDGMSSDVDDLLTASGSAGEMLRVAAAGGLEYRTTAQVLADIGAAPTASPTFTGTVTLPTTVASVVKPASDSTTALQLTNAAEMAVLTVDTTNNTVTVSNSSGTSALVLSGSGAERPGAQIRFSAGSDASKAGIFELDYAGNMVFRTSQNGMYFDFYNSLNLRYGESLAMIATVNAVGLYVGGGGVATAFVDAAPSTISAASLRIRSGTAPTSPNAGDVWFDGTNLKFYDGTTTRTISWT